MQQKTHDQAFELTNKQNQIDILNQKVRDFHSLELQQITNPVKQSYDFLYIII